MVKKRQAAVRRPISPVGRLNADDALLAVLLAAINANDHVSPDEARRAHHIIWSMRRFRRKAGDAVDASVNRMRELIERHGAPPVIGAAARAIPARLRPAVFAVSADLVLTDGRIERAERRFLDDLAATLGLARREARNIIDVMLIKNGA